MPSYLVVNETEVSYRNVTDTDFDELIKAHPNTGFITAPFGLNGKEFSEYLVGREDEIRQKLKNFSTPDLVRIFINITNSKGELHVYMGSLTQEPVIHKLPVIQMNSKSAFRTFANKVAEVLNNYTETYKHVEFYILGYSSFTEPLLEIASRGIYTNNNITTFEVPQGTASVPLMLISNLQRGIPKFCYVTPTTFKVPIKHSHNRTEYNAYITEVNKELRKILFDDFLNPKEEVVEEEVEETKPIATFGEEEEVVEEQKTEEPQEETEVEVAETQEELKEETEEPQEEIEELEEETQEPETREEEEEEVLQEEVEEANEEHQEEPQEETEEKVEEPKEETQEPQELQTLRKDLKDMMELCETQSLELEKLSQLKQVVEELKQENELLKIDSERLDFVEKSYDYAKVELKDLTDKNNELTDQVKTLQRDLKESEELRANLTSAEIETLTNELLIAKELQPKYDVLVENNKMITVKCDDLQIENVKLQAEVTEVLSEIKTAQAENEELKKQIVELQTKLKERDNLEEVNNKLDALMYLVNSVDNKVTSIESKELPKPIVPYEEETEDLEELIPPTLEELEEDIQEMSEIQEEVQEEVVEELALTTQEETDTLLEEELEIPEPVELDEEVIDLTSEVDNPDDFLSGVNLEIESDSALDDFFNNSGSLNSYLNSKLKN